MKKKHAIYKRKWQLVKKCFEDQNFLTFYLIQPLSRRWGGCMVKTREWAKKVGFH